MGMAIAAAWLVSMATLAARQPQSSAASDNALSSTIHPALLFTPRAPPTASGNSAVWANMLPPDFHFVDRSNLCAAARRFLNGAADALNEGADVEHHLGATISDHQGGGV